MTLPLITVYPDTIPSKGQNQVDFDANMNNYLPWQTTFATQLTPWITFANNLGAALLAGNLPPLTGQALKAVRVNAADDGIEMQTVTAAGWTFLAAADTAAQRTALEIPAPVSLTQAQAEDDASTVFGQVSGQRLAQAIAAGGWISQGVFATTSGTNIDITGIPTGAKRIRITFDSVSVSSTDDYLIQIGTGTTPKTTGYISGSGMVGSTVRENATTGFVIFSNDASHQVCGAVNLNKMGATNVWVASHAVTLSPNSNGTGAAGGGRTDLAGLIGMIRLTSLAGSQAYDGGSVFVEYQL